MQQKELDLTPLMAETILCGESGKNESLTYPHSSSLTRAPTSGNEMIISLGHQHQPIEFPPRIITQKPDPSLLGQRNTAAWSQVTDLSS